MLLGTAIAIPSLIGIAWAISLRPTLSVPERGSFDDLTYTVRTDKIEYAPGEIVRVVANVTNTGVATVTIQYASSCGGGMAFWDADGTLWYVPGIDELCMQVIVEIPLAPGKSLVRSFDWGQRDFDGSLVPSARAYRVQAGEGVVLDAEGSIEGVVQGETWFFIRSGG